MLYSRPRGVFDILPSPSEPWRSSEIWQFVESTIHHLAQSYGFREIRTPTFERTELFTRSAGETSDIVTKEMYTFLDKGERSMTLRPEGTAGAMRAFIEEKKEHDPLNQKLYYLAPMFRYERQQAGRYRQHHQFGVEAIGVSSPLQDVEIIDLLFNLYQKLGLNQLTLSLNSIGNTQSRENYKVELKKFLSSHFDHLSADSQSRFQTNPLRILDSKDPSDQAILSQAPKITDHLDEQSRQHFEQVCHYLKGLRIPFTLNPSLVRGLDYYQHTVFEVVTKHERAQNAIGGGGRYDGLLKQLGGSDLPSTGFGVGIERLILAMLEQNVSLPQKRAPLVYFIPMGDNACAFCLEKLSQLRKHGIHGEMDFSQKKLKQVLSKANQLEAKFVLIIGDQEMESMEAKMKEMETGKEIPISLNNLLVQLKDIL